MHPQYRIAIVALALVTLVNAGTASGQSYPVAIPHTFQPNTVARAGEVNADFQALMDYIDDLDGRLKSLQTTVTAQVGLISTLQSTVTAQTGFISTLQGNVDSHTLAISQVTNGANDNAADIADNAFNIVSNSQQVGALENLTQDMSRVTSTVNGLSGPHIIFEGVNLHLQNGHSSRSTMTTNGLGNLIIGYNERTEPWHDSDDRKGSHNLAIGTEHEYMSYGGLVSGYGHLIGSESGASGAYAVVIGGYKSAATADFSLVAGGRENFSSYNYAAVFGGKNGWSGGQSSVVVGGTGNTATSSYDTTVGSCYVCGN